MSFSPRRGDTCVTPLLVGRCDSPSALLQTGHDSLSRPRPQDRLRGLQAAGPPLPAVGRPGRALPHGPGSFFLVSCLLPRGAIFPN